MYPRGTEARRNSMHIRHLLSILLAIGGGSLLSNALWFTLTTQPGMPLFIFACCFILAAFIAGVDEWGGLDD